MDVLISAGIVVAALGLSAALGALLVSMILRWVEPEGYAPGVLRGGTWIGVLERLAITGAIIAGHPEAVAVVLAVKGLGRYPELRATHSAQRAKATERFIIGTLVSYLWAGLIGVLTTLVL